MKSLMSTIFFINTFCVLHAQKTSDGTLTIRSDEKRLEAITKKVNYERDSIGSLFQEQYKLLDNIKDSLERYKCNNIIEKYQKQFDSLTNILVKFDIAFIRDNPSSFFSLERLRLRFLRNELFPPSDTVFHLFNSLNSNIKKSDAGEEFSLMLTQFKNSSIGNIAPDFQIPDLNNVNLTLHSLRNYNYVLLDFWASWCQPCLEDFPFLKEMYSKYHSNGFEIIGISKDSDNQKWKNAILKDSLQIWRQIFSGQNCNKLNNSITDNYFVYGIPVKILIDKKGIIIGRWIGGGKENRIEINEKLFDIFENTF